MNRHFILGNLISSDISDNLKLGYDISFSLEDSSTREFIEKKVFRIDHLEDSKERIFESIPEGDYKLTISVNNNIRNTKSSPKICQVRLDATAPDPILQVDQKKKLNFIKLNGIERLATVDIVSDVSFVSSSEDSMDIEFCIVPQEDSKDKVPIEPHQWQEWSKKQGCDGYQVAKIRENQIVSFPSKRGYYSFRYRAFDSLSNVSPWKNQPLLFINRQAIELAKTNSEKSIRSQVESNQYLDAVKSSISAINIYQELPTLYEKSLFFEKLSLIVSSVENLDYSEIFPKTNLGSPNVFSISQNALAGLTDGDRQGYNLWNLRSGSLIKSKKITNFNSIGDFAVSDDGELGYVAYRSTGIEKIDMRSGEILNGPNLLSGALKIQKAKNGKWLIAFSDFELRLLETDEMKVQFSRKMLNSPLNNLSTSIQITTSNDDKLVAVTSGNPWRLEIFTLPELELVSELTLPKGCFGSVRFSSNRSSIIAANSEGKLVKFELPTMKKLSEFDQSTIEHVESSPDSDYFIADISQKAETLVYVINNNLLNFLDIGSQKLIRTLRMPMQAIKNPRIMNENRSVLMTDDKGKLRYFRLREEVDSRPASLPSTVTSLAMNSSGSFRFIDSQRKIYEWDLTTIVPNEVTKEDLSGFSSLQMSKNAENIIAVKDDVSTEILRFEDQTVRGRVDFSSVLGQFSNSARYLVDYNLNIWDIFENRQLPEIEPLRLGRIHATCIDELDSPMFVQTNDQFNYVIDPKIGKVLHKFETNVSSIHNLDFFLP